MSAPTQTALRLSWRLILASGLLAIFGPSALAQTPYVDARGQERKSPVTAATLTSGGAITLDAGWYLCEGPVKYTGTVTISGAVNLILGDACDMRVTGSQGDAGINVTLLESSLTVWGASSYSKSKPFTQGRLAVKASDGAGIGGGNSRGGRATGAITIHGGDVKATGNLGAGIGGRGSTIIIDGGWVNAIGGDGSAGIGGSVITIEGAAFVDAIGGNGGAGIGGGSGDGSGVIAILGLATVNAIGGSDGAGIGGGKHGAGDTITIRSTRTVNVAGGKGAAGIGGGRHGAGGMIAIEGLNIGVFSDGGAGIGSGSNVEGAPLDAGTITIGAISFPDLAILGASSRPGANIGQGSHGEGKAGAGISPIFVSIPNEVVAGSDAVYSVTVNPTGTPAPKITYQWQKAKQEGYDIPAQWSNVVDGPGVTGASSATLKLSGLTASTDPYRYRCVLKVTGVGEKSSIVYTTDYYLPVVDE
jgi:hypothetical protein